MDGLTGNAEWRFQHHFPRLERSRQQLRGDIIRPRWEEEDRGVRMHLESRESERNVRTRWAHERRTECRPIDRPTASYRLAESVSTHTLFTEGRRGLVLRCVRHFFCWMFFITHFIPSYEQQTQITIMITALSSALFWVGASTHCYSFLCCGRTRLDLPRSISNRVKTEWFGDFGCSRCVEQVLFVCED